MRPRALLNIAATVAVFWASRQVVADELFSLVIDPVTGAAQLRNDSDAPVSIDGYFLASPTEPVLNFSGWNGLESAAVSGWREFSASNRLGEVNLFEALDIPARGAVSIGAPYQPFAPTTFGQPEPGLSSLRFTYSVAGEPEQRVGDIEFSARNTIVLVVDPATGAASLQNQSAFDVSLDSYLVKSIPAVLSPTSWDPLAGTDAAWRASPGRANRVAEGNLFGATLLPARGGSLPLGTPVDPALLNDEQDLQLEFTISGLPEALVGGVLFASATTAPSADFDGNGSVDSADLGTWASGFGGVGSAAQGDANGNGRIDGGDFLTWQRQFGAGGGGAAVASAAMVPEPAAASLACLGAIALGTQRRVRRGRS
jgi:hypothetical protein